MKNGDYLLISEDIGLTNYVPEEETFDYAWLPTYSNVLNNWFDRYGIIGFKPKTGEYYTSLVVTNSLKKMHSQFVSTIWYWADEEGNIWYNRYAD